MKHVFENAILRGTITTTPQGLVFSGEVEDLIPEAKTVFALPWMPPHLVKPPTD